MIAKTASLRYKERVDTAPSLPLAIPVNRSSSDEAHGKSPADLYRSNLLGSDLTVTHFGGGNTSAQLEERDPLTGVPTPVLWVNGSGGDLGVATLTLPRLCTFSLPRCLRSPPATWSMWMPGIPSPRGRRDTHCKPLHRHWMDHAFGAAR